MKRSESLPLLPIASKHNKDKTTFYLDKAYINDDQDDDTIIYAQKKRRNTSLIGQDAFLYILYYIQLFAFLQSLGLRWALPTTWINITKYSFLFNLDIWEFCKAAGNRTYVPIQGYYTPSENLPFMYWHILAAWVALLFLALVLYLITYLILTYRRRPTLLIQIGRLQHFYIIFAQIISLPVGTVLARLFHCNSRGFVDIDNTLLCYQAPHWAYLAPAMGFSFVFYILFAGYLITKTKTEVLNMTAERHEGYIQLKEAEYKYGLDILWVVSNFHIFSSFRKRATHFRAAMHIVNYGLCLIYASLYNFMFAQTLTITCAFFVAFLAFIAMRPFRVKAFNYYIIVAFLCLVANSLMGAFITSFSTSSTFSVWTTPTYVIGVLSFVNILWVCIAVLLGLYLIVARINCCKLARFSEPLWPSVLSQNVNKMLPHTKKYIKAILKARTVVEMVVIQPAIFAPAHELARQIHIVNAYCREAEFLKDPIHDTLWDVLDELIEAHEMIAPKSLFAESVKDSIRLTACELMKMMPQFVRRLAQREFDFILMRPVKRRLLLKMYCMGLFLNGRRERVERQRLTVPGIKKIWQQERKHEYETEDDGYYEDMYPEAEEGPVYRPNTAVSIDINVFAENEIDDDLDVEEVEAWTAAHPLPYDPTDGQENKAFQDEDFMMDDNDSVDLSVLMQDVPSRPITANSIRTMDASATNLRAPTGSLVIGSRSSLQVPTPRAGSASTALRMSPRESAVSSRPASASAAMGSYASQRPSTASQGRPLFATPSPIGSLTPRAASQAKSEESNKSPLPGQISDE